MKKRKRKRSETNVDDSAVLMDKSLIKTSSTVTDNEQPDAIKKHSHKRSKTSNHNSGSRLNAISPSNSSITDIIHSEWRISKEKMSDLKSKGNFHDNALKPEDFLQESNFVFK